MIILFGMAGSGKGTQGNALAEIFGWKTLSVGQIIRDTNEFNDIINCGKLIPTEDVIRLMNHQIEIAEEEGFDVILDGYPRDIEQAEYIVNNMVDKIDGAIILEVPKEELINRLSLRGREDDKDTESIERRFQIFNDNIRPMVKLFEQHDIPVKRVNGVGKVEDVTHRLVETVEKIVPRATEQETDVNGGEIEKSYGE